MKRSTPYIMMALVLALGACSGSGAPAPVDDVNKPPVGGPPTPPDIAPPPPAVSAVVGISGLADGAILGGPTDVTANAAASPNNASYAWSLTSPTLPDAKTGAGGTFAFSVPAAKDPTAADQYSLQLTATSTTGATDSKTINFQVYPAPSPKIEMQGACPVAGCPFNGPITLHITDGFAFASDFKWQIAGPTNASAVVCDATFDDGKTCVYTPTEEGAFKASVAATGKGGSAASNTVSFSVAKGVPVAKMSGSNAGQNFFIAPLTLGGNSKDYPNDVVTYTWTITKDGLKQANPPTGDSLPPLKDPGDYLISLQVTVNGKPSNTVVVGFTLLPELTVKIKGATNVPIGIPLPAVVPVSKKNVSLKADTDITADYGPATYAWVMKKPDQFVVTLGNADIQDVQFDKPGNYTIKVTVTAMDKTVKDIANTTAAYQAIATMDGIQDKHSYLKRDLRVTSNNSQYAPQVSWTLFGANMQSVPNYTGVTDTTLGIHEADLNYGPYTLQLTANNPSGLNASIDNEDFNIRVAGKENILPFDFGNAQSVYVLDESNIFVGSSTGLLHLGEDGLWADERQGHKQTAIWARSPNEVYVVATQGGKGIFSRYTAKDGWRDLKGTATFPGPDVIALTGTIDHVVAIGSDTRLYAGDDTGWTMVEEGAGLVAAPSDKSGVFFAVLAKPGTVKGDLLGFDKNLKLISHATLPGQSWTAMVAVSPKLVYLANPDGRVYSSDGKTVTLVGKLPTYNNGVIQQYAKLMWKMGSRVMVLTQNGGAYAVHGKAFSGQIAPSAFEVDSAAAAENTIVAISKGEIYSPRPSNPVTWAKLFPDATDFLLQPVYADKTTTARNSGESVYVMNAVTKLNGADSYLQQIAPDGTRTALDVKKPVTTLFGAKGEAYFVTDDGLFMVNGTGGPVTPMGKAPAKILALDGEPTSSVKSGTIYAMTDLGLFQSNEGHDFKSIVTLQDPLHATALHMLDGKWILATTTGKANYITIGDLAQDLAQDNVNLTEPESGGVPAKIVSIGGPDLDRLFAVGDTGDLYQYNKTTTQWDPFKVPVAIGNINGFVFREVQQDATHLYFKANKGMVTYDLGTSTPTSVDVGTPLGSYIFYAQGSPDYVYFGIGAQLNPGAPIKLYFSRIGPMQ